MTNEEFRARFNLYVQGFLAVVVTIGFFVVIAVLFASKDIASSVKDILLVLIGALLASFKEITGYFFGSSSGSAKKDDQNAALAAQLTGPTTPPAPVTDTGTPIVALANDAEHPVPVVDVPAAPAVVPPKVKT